ncbi:MAG: glutamate--tRNA ligase [Candidatus Omnitrophota bacterium]
MVRVRFAPSPTGFLHIGGARTALFNWMYARSQQGKFILRIEDTDLSRSKKEFVEEILKSLTWLGLNWDEIYLQSERFSLYKEYAEKLLHLGKAYKEGEAVLLRVPKKEIKIYDLIRGEIQFDTETIKDQVLIKSDGSPTYSFACVIDDALMEISHVIRGEDHISNTPKQIVIYEELGFKLPKFAHLPLIMGTDGARLSKRTGAVAVSDYQKEGFLPDALNNYLMLLGWSPGNNQEVIEMGTALKKFSIKKINKAAAVFSLDKLKWINTQHIKQKEAGVLRELLVPFLREKGFIGEQYDSQRLEEVIRLYQGRMSTLVDFLEWTDFLFLQKREISPDLRDQFSLPGKAKEFGLLSEELNTIKDFNPGSAETVFRAVVAGLGIKSGDLVHPVRVALTGKTVGPGLFETMALLGKEETVKRLKEAVQ